MEGRRPNPELLRTQALSMRSVSRGAIRSARDSEAPTWKKVACIGFFVLVIGAAVYLLASADARHGLISQAELAWGSVYGASEDRVHALPPPSRQQLIAEDVTRRAAPPARVRQGGQPADSQEVDTDKVILYYTDNPSDLLGDKPGSSRSADAQQSPGTPQKNESNTQAFEFLKANSAAAKAVVEGQAEGYQFVDWKPVQDDPPRFFINLASTNQAGREVLLIWRVDLESNSVEAMSQEARELAAKLKN